MAEKAERRVEEGYLKREDPAFPPQLARIKEAPRGLYYRGDLSLLKSRMVAVVGSRKITSYGKRIADRIASRLAASGVTVVSGLAMGIDGLAHEGALREGGKTVAVLGNGLDIVFPLAHRRLQEQIAGEGLLLSEYPPGTHGNRFTFPKRNRIISGLCEATVVVEARLNSGSLITAELANEQGRNVYAVPGNIDSVYSHGCNLLIRDGASPLMEVEDLLRDLGLGREARRGLSEEGLGEEEIRLLGMLREGAEYSVDQLAEGLALPPARVNGLVSVLEIKGLVSTSLGKVFPAL